MTVCTLNLMARKSAIVGGCCTTMTIIGFKNFGLTCMMTPMFVSSDHQVTLSTVSVCFARSKNEIICVLEG